MLLLLSLHIVILFPSLPHLCPELGQFRLFSEVKLAGGVLEGGDVVRPFAECDHDRGSGHHLTRAPGEDAGLGGEGEEDRLRREHREWKAC